MKYDMFPSYTEFIQRSEMIKNRQERLVQVRQQSKQMATQVLEKMRKAAEKEYEKTERLMLSEICELHSKELVAMRNIYEDCILKINQEHYTKPVKAQMKENPTTKNVFLEKRTTTCSDFLNSYTQRVHDRIRVLEQKDKMLQRRAVFTTQFDRMTVTSPKKLAKSVTTQTVEEQPLCHTIKESTSTETESSSHEKAVQVAIEAPKDHAHVKKLHNWRNVFSNGERLSESSYFSPPSTSRNEPKEKTKKKKCKRKYLVNAATPPRNEPKVETKNKKKCKRKFLRVSASDESEKDIEYYVAKLLLMSPQSIENLNSISEETITSTSISEHEVQRSDYESMNEEEFLRKMLHVRIPERQNLENETEADNVKPMKSSDISKPAETSNIFKDSSPNDLKLESRLSSWIGTSIRRTLEASAINSTSSYDDTENPRRASTALSFSPMRVSNFKLSVPQLSGMST